MNSVTVKYVKHPQLRRTPPHRKNMKFLWKLLVSFFLRQIIPKLPRIPRKKVAKFWATFKVSYLHHSLPPDLYRVMVVMWNAIVRIVSRMPKRPRTLLILDIPLSPDDWNSKKRLNCVHTLANEQKKRMAAGASFMVA